jgi:pSer/pThr/pTyr-binding forkhead associated (FHA) protein
MENLANIPISKVSIKILDDGVEILLEQGEYILGRTTQDRTQGSNSASIPSGHTDIDLSPYQAYEAGVSRHHASLFVGFDAVTLTDLGSTNGTRLNGVTIQAFTPEELGNEDIITLSKLKIQIFIKTSRGD